MTTTVCLLNNAGAVFASNNTRSIHAFPGNIPIVMAVETKEGFLAKEWADIIQSFPVDSIAETKCFQTIIEGFLEYLASLELDVNPIDGDCDAMGAELVFQGYGHDEFFPSYAHVSIHSTPGGKLFINPIKADMISQFDEPHYEVIGDDTEVETLLDSIDQPIFDAVIEYQNDLIERLKAKYLEETKRVTKSKKVISAIEEFDTDRPKQAFYNRVCRTIEEDFCGRINVGLDSFNISDLTSIAETLVDLGGMQRHLLSPEVPAMPTAQIVIVNGYEGVVWIKR